MTRTIIMSFDALGQDDREEFEKLDGFKYFIDKGAYVREMESVYPTLTYPCHTSMVSGRLPCQHGVINNLLLQPSMEEKKDWSWYEKYVKADTIFKAAKRKGLRTGAILWPVTASGNIDSLISEIWPHRPYHSLASVALANGTPKTLARSEVRHGHLRRGKDQPYLDDYTEACLHDMILEDDLDLIVAHFLAVDDHKHKYGCKSDKVKMAIESYNDRINNLLSLLDDKGIKANIFIVSDHSQIDVHTGIRLNSLLNDWGHLQVKNSKIFKYKYYMQEAGGSAYIYSKGSSPEEDRVLYDQLVDLGQSQEIFDAIYTADQAADLGADPTCLFMIEARRGYYFIEGHEGPLLETERLGLKATHGYSPHKENFSPVLFALGPGIANTKLDRGRLIDIGPTVSRLMGLGLRGGQGQPLAILKKDKGEI